MSETSTFTGWAMIELFGHNKEIGYVTTEYFGGAAMFRVDVPALDEREITLIHPEYAAGDGCTEWCPAGSLVKRQAMPARSRLIGPAAVYALNPCTEIAAREAIERTSRRPLILIEKPAKGALPEPDQESGGEYEADENEVAF